MGILRAAFRSITGFFKGDIGGPALFADEKLVADHSVEYPPVPEYPIWFKRNT